MEWCLHEVHTILEERTRLLKSRTDIWHHFPQLNAFYYFPTYKKNGTSKTKLMTKVRKTDTPQLFTHYHKRTNKNCVIQNKIEVGIFQQTISPEFFLLKSAIAILE